MRSQPAILHNHHSPTAFIPKSTLKPRLAVQSCPRGPCFPLTVRGSVRHSAPLAIRSVQLGAILERRHSSLPSFFRAHRGFGVQRNTALAQEGGVQQSGSPRPTFLRNPASDFLSDPRPPRSTHAWTLLRLLHVTMHPLHRDTRLTYEVRFQRRPSSAARLIAPPQIPPP